MLIQSIFDEMKKIILNMEVKYKYLGEKRDTAETKYNADMYINAMEKADGFFSHVVINVDAIIQSGLTLDPAQAAEYSLNPTSIPTIWRDKVLEAQRRIIITNYDEGNDYFRRLNGLPEADQTAVYLDLDFYDEYNIEFKPLHEFTDIEVMMAEAANKLQPIKDAYPDLKYLHYLGEKRIDPYSARRAANFQVLRVNYSGDYDLLDRFLTIYEQCREYTMRILYVNEFSTTDSLYDNFMAMMTAIMAVQRTLTSIYQGVISRDFFDIHLVQALFESYGVPFIKSLPMDYQKLLAKNLDKLLHYKSTDKVIYDITEILGFGNAEIFKYFLVKDHRFDEKGQPIYDYITNEHGETVPNYATMYDVYFQTLDLKEENEEFALADKVNRREYNETVSDDAYWWSDDEELLKRLYETEFTYIETKYLHLNVMFKITEMIFELVHVFRMLQDKKSQTSKLTISIPRILPDRKITLFTFTVFMCAAIAKRNNLTGEIITAPSKTLYLLGFDFGRDLQRIRQALEENSKHVDHMTIAGYIRDMEVYTHKDVDELFNNIRGLWEFLSLQLKNARTIEEYRAYERIYQALLVTQDMEEIFTKSDGEVATTYLDMLRDLDPYLANVIDTATPENLFAYLNHGIDSIQYIIKDTKYLYGLTDTSQVMVDALRKLILFFKSYTVDLKDFNIIYVFDHPYLHGIKLISQLMEITSEIDMNSKYIHDMMLDYLHIASRMTKKDRLQIVRELIDLEVTLEIKDMIIFITKLAAESELDINTKIMLVNVLLIESDMSYADRIQFIKETISVEVTAEIKQILAFVGKLVMDSDIGINTRYTLVHTLMLELTMLAKDELGLDDAITTIITELSESITLFKSLIHIIESDTTISDKIASIHTLWQESDMYKQNAISTSESIQSIEKLMYDVQRGLLEVEEVIESDFDISSKNIMISTLRQESDMYNHETIIMNESLQPIQKLMYMIQRGLLAIEEVIESEFDINTENIMMSTLRQESELSAKIQISFDEMLDNIQSYMTGLTHKLIEREGIVIESDTSIASKNLLMDTVKTSVETNIPFDVIKMREQIFVIRD